MFVESERNASAREMRGLSQLVAEQAAMRGDAVAIEDRERQLTYGELDAIAGAIAAGLRAEGVGPGDVLGVALPRSWRAVAAWLGTMRAGAAYLPVNPEHPARRRTRLLTLARAVALIAAVEDGAAPAGCRTLGFDELAAGPATAPASAAAAGDEDLAYVLFTSGSTGEPKGVEITHANMLHLLGCGSPLVPRREDTVLGIAPVEFDIGVLETWGALSSGAKLVQAPPGRPDPERIGRLIAERGVTYAFFAAGLFEQVVRAALPDLAGLRVLAAGGDVMSPAAAAAVRETHPRIRLLNAYGPTETSIVASCFEVEGVDGSPLPIGRPLPGYRFHVLDPDGRPVPEGEAGELWIGGPGVGRGYRDDPERTADRFRPDGDGRVYGTGDSARWREDGELSFLGRIDDQVKIAGHRIEPGEVEGALASHPDVGHAAVVAREDVDGHRRLLAYVSLREGRGSAAALMEHLGERLPAYMLPAGIEVLPELPLTERGKVDRKALPAPRRRVGPEEETIAGEIAGEMADLLGLDGVGPDEDFFAIGADSLLALQLVGRLRERLDPELGIDAVFEVGTARGLAARLETGSGGSPRRPPLRRRAEEGPAPATFAQRRAWLFEKTNPESLAFQFAAVIHLEGELDEDALAGALGDLVRRHGALRTAIVDRGGEPVQEVRSEVPLPLERIDLRGADRGAWARLARERARARIALDRAPLVRWTLARRGERAWSLIDVEHHAVHDGWSFMVVLDELAELYSARVQRRPPELPPVAAGLGDFAAWERALADGPVGQRQLAHWKRVLDPDPPLLELPTTRRRPPRESFSGGSVRRGFDPELADGLRALAREEGATLFMACLAGFALLLSRLSGQPRLQIGSGLANRAEPAAARTVGMTVATVAMPVDLSGDPDVRELLRRVRSSALGAVANSEVPFERVVEALSPPRRADRSPLVQALFSFDDAPARGRAWAGLTARVVQTIPNGSAKADLNVIGVDHGNGAPFFIWEHSDLLTDAAADRLAGRHLRLLEQFVADPDARVSKLDLLDERERAELREWAGSGEYGREVTVPELVAARARREPGATAVVDERGTLTYAELLERAGGVAAALRRRGVEPGDAVGVLLGRSREAIVAQLGALAAGAAYVPLEPRFPDARISQVLADAEARVVLTDRRSASRLPVGLAAVAVEETGRCPFLAAPSRPDDLAYVIYTSGSTGEPKGVEVTHRNVARLVDDPDYAELGPGTVMLNAASPAFDAATLEIWGPLANGGTVACLTEIASADSVAAAIELHAVTTLWLTAGLFHQLVERQPECLARVRHLLAGGDVLSPEHVRRALAALPPEGRLTNGYGPTETTTFATTHELRPGDEVGDVVPIGRPIQATTCHVLDQAGRPLPVGAVGELAIGGDGVSRGYRGDPALTAARFRRDPERPAKRLYLTGDRVRRRPDGVLEFAGRADRQVKIRGHRVEPAEVESALRAHPRVADVAVEPFERGPGDLALAAYVVSEPGRTAPGPRALRTHAVDRLPAAMVPAAWIALPRLPLTRNGKLDRAALPRPGARHLARDGVEAAPADELERLVVDAFQRVLGVEPVGVEDDFFALGGHSLLAVELFAELERIGRRRLPLATVFEASTPRDLAACIGAPTPDSRWDNLVALKPSGERPPLFAVSAGDGNIVGFGPLSRHLPDEQPLYALQPTGLDGRRPLDVGVGRMAARYLEALRRVQPRGPYLLAGRCNGATVAYEMAQQLRAAGEKVPLLAVLDSSPPAPRPAELAPGVAFDTIAEAATVRARRAGLTPPDPGRPEGAARLAAWLCEPLAPGVSRYLHEFWRWREDLQRAWPDPLGSDAESLARFAWDHATDELEPALLQPVASRNCRIEGGLTWDRVMSAAWAEHSEDPPRPFSPRGRRRFREVLVEPVGGGVNRYLLTAWEGRHDLRQAFPDPLGDSAEALRAWAWEHGVGEGLQAPLLPPSPWPISPRQRLSLALLPARAAGAHAGRRLAENGREIASGARLAAIGLVERQLGRPLPGAGRRTILKALAAARRARSEYRADPWPGRVVLIVSEEFRDKSSYLGWDMRAEGGVDRHELPFGHVGMLREPGAASLAACLAASIEEALGS